MCWRPAHKKHPDGNQPPCILSKEYQYGASLLTCRGSTNVIKHVLNSNTKLGQIIFQVLKENQRYDASYTTPINAQNTDTRSRRHQLECCLLSGLSDAAHDAVWQVEAVPTFTRCLSKPSYAKITYRVITFKHLLRHKHQTGYAGPKALHLCQMRPQPFKTFCVLLQRTLGVRIEIHFTEAILQVRLDGGDEVDLCLGIGSVFADCLFAWRSEKSFEHFVWRKFCVC
jgi:hypothetical protein